MAAKTTAVLFDLDDTLFDHRACTRDALAALRGLFPALRTLSDEAVEMEHNRVLEELHLEVLGGRLTVDGARAERFRRLLEYAGSRAGAAEAQQAAAAYRTAYVAGWRPVAGALDLLAALHGRAATGVVTNNAAPEQRQKIAACGFEPFLDAIVISEEVGVIKPDPRIFDIALDRLGRRAGDAVMVGDSWGIDILGARAAGLRPVWFNRLGAASPDPSVTEISSLCPAADLLSMLFECPEYRTPNPESRTPNPESRS